MNEEEEKKNNLPAIENGEAIPNFLKKYNWFGVDPGPYRLDFSKQYEAPKYTLSWNGIGFAPLGGIHAVTGQSGHGKTMTLAQFISAILCGDFGNLHYELSEEVPEPTVLYIDTEMEEANTIAMKNRVMTMCGRPIGRNYDDFVVLMLREVTSEDKKETSALIRWRMTLKALHQYKPTVCFIDGLLDLVNDFNNNTECQEIIYDCMQAATYYNISLWCLVHQNPGADKLVGHLGSMLERKVTDIFRTSKEKNETTGLATFTVKQLKARGRDIPDWKFQVLPVTGWGMPEQIKTAPLDNHDPELIRTWLEDGQFDISWPATLAEIKGLIKTRGGVTNNTQLQADVTVAKNRRFILPQPESEMEKRQRTPKYYLSKDEIKVIVPEGTQEDVF